MKKKGIDVEEVRNCLILMCLIMNKMKVEVKNSRAGKERLWIVEERLEKE